MSLSESDKDHIKIRDMDVVDLMRNYSFTDAICLLWRGNLPDEVERRLLDAMLVSSVIHTEQSPSIVAAKTVFQSGSTIEAAVAAGALTMGFAHGGAVRNFAKILQTKIKFDYDVTTIAKQLVIDYSTKGQRIPGYGHILHRRDPRTVCLLQLAKEYGKYGKYCELAETIQYELERKTGKVVPLNITGAMAAVLSELGFDWKIGTAFFLLSRTVGVVAAVQEE